MSARASDIRRTTLATLAFVAGGAVPIQLITLSFGWAQYVRMDRRRTGRAITRRLSDERTVKC